MSNNNHVCVEYDTIDGVSASVPKYATSGSAGCDLVAAEDYILYVGGHKLVRTGLRIKLPAGVEAQVRARSGLALKHGVTVLNGVGTIDSDYRGEIGVILINHGTKDYVITKGDRVAQLVIAPVFRATFEKVEMLPGTSRSDGGFGSTGT